jgi:hypothetical protein
MKNKKDLNRECDGFSAPIIGDIAWIVLKGNLLMQSTNLQKNQLIH